MMGDESVIVRLSLDGIVMMMGVEGRGRREKKSPSSDSLPRFFELERHVLSLMSSFVAFSSTMK